MFVGLTNHFGNDCDHVIKPPKYGDIVWNHWTIPPQFGQFCGQSPLRTTPFQDRWNCWKHRQRFYTGSHWRWFWRLYVHFCQSWSLVVQFDFHRIFLDFGITNTMQNKMLITKFQTIWRGRWWVHELHHNLKFLHIVTYVGQIEDWSFEYSTCQEWVQ